MVYNGINYAINEYKNFDTFKTIATYFLFGLNLRFSVHVVRSLWPHHNGITMRIKEKNSTHLPPSSSFKAFSFESSNQSVQIMMRNYPKFLQTTIILESLYCPHSNYGAECSSVFIFLWLFFFVLPFLHHLFFFFACAKLLIKTGHETDRLKGFSSFERVWIIIVMLFFLSHFSLNGMI